MIESLEKIDNRIESTRRAIATLRDMQVKAYNERVKLERDPAYSVEVEGLTLTMSALDEAMEWIDQYQDMLVFGRQCWDEARKEFDKPSHKEEE